MRIQEQFQLLVRLDQLIRLKATGTPAMLAQRFNVSERTVYYLIVRLKDLGDQLNIAESVNVIVIRRV